MDHDPTTATSPRHDPAAEPDEDFWLGGLHVASFRKLVSLCQSPGELDSAFKESWSGGVNERAAREVFGEYGDGPEVQLNLVLLAAFIEKKQQEAILDVARSILPEEVLSGHEAFSGRCHRHAAASLIYRQDPARLLDIFLLDEWHPRRRCAYRLEGQPRDLPGKQKLQELPWDAMIRDELGRVRTAHGMTFGSVVRRTWAGDVLVAVRDRGTQQTFRQEDDRVYPGHRDDWTFLRFHDNLHRVDVTSGMVLRAAELASAVASSVWGDKRRYVEARDPLDRRRLDEFLSDVVDPSGDVFKLHEITAEVPGRWRHPVIRVGNRGSERVENVVQDLLAHCGYAATSDSVYRVKVGFEARKSHYRVELHFPTPQDDERDLVLSYGDRGWSKNVASAFEKLIQQEIGVEVHPKAPSAARIPTRQHYPLKPARFTPAEWRKMLVPKLDDPAPWQEEALADLADKGLVRLTHHSVFRCGDRHIPMHRRTLADSLECSGEVVMPFRSVPGQDPLWPEPGRTFVCDENAHCWEVYDDYHFPSFHRIAVEIVPEAAWRKVATVARSRGTLFEPSVPGVLYCMGSDAMPRYIVFPRHAAASWMDKGRTLYGPTCWFGLDDEEVSSFRPAAFTLADVLGGGGDVIRKVLDLKSLPALDGQLAGEEEGPVVPMPAAPSTTVRLEDLPVKTIQPSDGGIVLGNRIVSLPSDRRIWLLYSLYQELDAKEGASLAEDRRYASAEDLIEVARERMAKDRGRSISETQAPFEAGDVHQWVRRARVDIERTYGKDAGKKIIESGGRRGTRLALGVECRGFSVQDELARYKEWQNARKRSEVK